MKRGRSNGANINDLERHLSCFKPFYILYLGKDNNSEDMFKHELESVINTILMVMSKVKDFLRSEAVKYVIKVVHLENTARYSVTTNHQ